MALTIIIYSIPHQFSLSSYDFYHKERTKIFWDDFKVLFFFFSIYQPEKNCASASISFFFFLSKERGMSLSNNWNFLGKLLNILK